jgi:hypothetical protein
MKPQTKKQRVEAKRKVLRFKLSGGVARHLLSFLDTKSIALADQIWPEDMMTNATQVTFARDMDTMPTVAKVRLLRKANHVKRLAFDGCREPSMDLLSAALAHPSLTALRFTDLWYNRFGYEEEYLEWQHFWSSEALLGHTTLRALEIHTTLSEAAVPERPFWQRHRELEEFIWRDTMIQLRFESRAFQPMIELAGKALRRIDLDIDASERHVCTVFQGCRRLETLCLRIWAYEAESWSSETLFKRAPATLRRLMLATAPFRDSHWIMDWEREDDTERLAMHMDDDDDEREGMGKTQWRQIQAFLTRPARWSRMDVWVPSVTKWMSTVADGIHVRELVLKVAKSSASFEDQMKEDLFLGKKIKGLQRLELSIATQRTVRWTSPGRVECEDCKEDQCLQWLQVVPRNCTWVELDGYDRCPPVHEVLKRQPNLEVLRLAPCTIFDVVAPTDSLFDLETIKGLSASASDLTRLRELSLLGRILDRRDWKTLMDACGKTIEYLEVLLHIRETQPNEWLDRPDFERLDSKNLRHLTFHAHFVDRTNRGEDQRGVLSYTDTLLPLVARHPRLEHLSFGCPWIHWNDASKPLLQSSSLREATLVFPREWALPRTRIDNALASCAALRSLVLLFPDPVNYSSEMERPYIRASKGFENRSVVLMSVLYYKKQNRHLLMAPPGNWISVPRTGSLVRWYTESYESPVDPEPTVPLGPLSSITDAKDEPMMVDREHAADYKDTVQRQAAQLLAGHAVELQGDNATVTIQPDLTIQSSLDSSLLIRASLASWQPNHMS